MCMYYLSFWGQGVQILLRRVPCKAIINMLARPGFSSEGSILFLKIIILSFIYLPYSSQTSQKSGGYTPNPKPDRFPLWPGYNETTLDCAELESKRSRGRQDFHSHWLIKCPTSGMSVEALWGDGNWTPIQLSWEAPLHNPPLGIKRGQLGNLTFLSPHGSNEAPSPTGQVNLLAKVIG